MGIAKARVVREVFGRLWLSQTQQILGGGDHEARHDADFAPDRRLVFRRSGYAQRHIKILAEDVDELIGQVQFQINVGIEEPKLGDGAGQET